MTSRRQFLNACAWTGGAACAGCLSGAPEAGRRSARDYFCTWETQRALWKGATCERDNMNEEVLFGREGWVNLFPAARQGLLMVLDDGWDVPYGATNRDAGFAAFGSLVPDPARFPSLKGTTVARLGELRRRLRDAGWRGLGLWVAAQAAGETYRNPFDFRRLEEDVKRKLGESAEAGVAYWKVDWGVHSAEIAYREMMSRLARQYAPDTIVDHSTGFDNALNGIAYPYAQPTPAGGRMDLVGTTGRMLGNPLFEPVRRRYTALMAFSDSFRTYDTLGPMTSATALERAVFELNCADATESRCTINVEDEPLIGAALAVGIGVMRAANWPAPKVFEPEPKARRIAEIARCVNWRRFAPVFGSDRKAPVVWSRFYGEETWRYEKDSTWWSEAFGRQVFQRAPSVVARGLPLPEVRPLEGERPLVCASVHPDTQAAAVASLPLLTVSRGRHTPRAAVTLAATLAPGRPLGVFGVFAEVALCDGTGGGRVLARDLAGGPAEDITASCARAAGRIVLPGARLARIGTGGNPAGDPSSPGVVVTVA